MDKKERKLTPAEQKRKSDFDRICDEMVKNGSGLQFKFLCDKTRNPKISIGRQVGVQA